MARVAFAVGAFVIGVALGGIAVLGLFSVDRPLSLGADALARLGVNSGATAARAPAAVLSTPEALAFDVGPGTAGIQQPAPSAESTAPAAPTAAPIPTPEPPASTAIAVTRRATIQAPAGFNGAVLREGPATSARSVRQLSNRTPVEVLEGSAAGDGFTWARVRTQDGAAGWIVATAIAG